MERAEPQPRGDHVLCRGPDIAAARRGIGPGQSLDPATQVVMGAAFGRDFSQVRVHTGATATAAARAVHARAFTHGRDIVFGVPVDQALLAHELAHVAWQDRRPGAPVVQCDDDRAALAERLRVVRARLAELRRRAGQSTERFADATARDRQRQSLARERERSQRQQRVAAGAAQLWGGSVAATRIQRAVTVIRSGNDVTLAVPLYLTYTGVPDQAARRRAQQDAPRIEEAIRNVWRVRISDGEYRGTDFSLRSQVTYLQDAGRRPPGAFLIQVRRPDHDPSFGTSTTGTISLAPVHLEGARVVVVAHELAHLFGFMDTYFSVTTNRAAGPHEQWSVGRTDPAGRADLLGMIDPHFLQRRLQRGEVTEQDVRRQTGPVHVWEEEATTVLRTLGVPPPAPTPPGPDSEDFDPETALDRERREREGQLGSLRERRRRAEESVQWLDTAEEIIRLEAEERELARRSGGTP
jgi:hypothetical protein